uniref:Uncharacterized protein n=1 Tax=Anopheles atroparvus TaxID=41427 RepID=A0AAG5CS58_ANOAO
MLSQGLCRAPGHLPTLPIDSSTRRTFRHSKNTLPRTRCKRKTMLPDFPGAGGSRKLLEHHPHHCWPALPPGEGVGCHRVENSIELSTNRIRENKGNPFVP